MIWLSGKGHPSDGHPHYGGWPAIYSFYLDRGMSKDEIDEMPLYLACLGMGAITRDKTSMRFSEYDEGAYRVAVAQKKQRQGHG